MKLSELLAAVGDGNVHFQNLATDSCNVTNGKKGAQIRFNTGRDKAQAIMAAALDQEPEWLGLVVWLPVDRLPESVRVALRPVGEDKTGWEEGS